MQAYQKWHFLSTSAVSSLLTISGCSFNKRKKADNYREQEVIFKQQHAFQPLKLTLYMHFIDN